MLQDKNVSFLIAGKPAHTSMSIGKQRKIDNRTWFQTRGASEIKQKQSEPIRTAEQTTAMSSGDEQQRRTTGIRLRACGFRPLWGSLRARPLRVPPGLADCSLSPSGILLPPRGALLALFFFDINMNSSANSNLCHSTIVIRLIFIVAPAVHSSLDLNFSFEYTFIHHHFFMCISMMSISR